MSYEEQNKIIKLQEYVSALMKGDDKKLLYLKYQEFINEVVPLDVIKIEYSFLEKGVLAIKLLETVDMLMNVFHKRLSEYKWEMPKKNSFVFYLMKENIQVINSMNNLKKYISNQTFGVDKHAILLILDDLKLFDSHYQKIENIIFPMMQKKLEEFDGLAIMWELHVLVRKTLKTLHEQFNGKIIEKKFVNQLIGKLFFQIQGLIKKEELILFPLVSTILNENENQQMFAHSKEYNYYHLEINNHSLVFESTDVALTISEAKLLLNHLPFDITFIDEYDKVTYFNKTNNRFFPRSGSSIGLDVRQCHPPKSVHIVEKILDAFKEGKENEAVFWINVKEKKVLISYYAIRDDKKGYKGTLEVVQDITKIHAITGEKRLLDW
ncbi:MAG: DUF438 domain-containing protein [Clostridiales bacterium]|nr:DUF438 domain-containing protein [Clostridiales bacterium]